MKFFGSVIIAISSFLVGFSSSERVTGIYITSLIPANNENLPPLVNGAEGCGGEGFHGGLRLEGCLGEGTCAIQADGQAHKLVLEFAPSRNMASLGFRLIPEFSGSDRQFDSGPISNSSVQQGYGFLLHASIIVDDYVHAGTSVTNRFLIYDAQDPAHVDICVAAEFYVY